MKKRPTKNKMLLWGGIAMVGVLILWAIMRYLDQHPSTDDAYVQAGTINIAAQITGPVDKIYVRDHEFVKKDQLLFTIDPEPFQIAVDKAEANVAAQQASLVFAQQNADRTLRLLKVGQASKAAGDDAKAKLNSAKADLLADQAQLAKAKLDLEHTQIKAPLNGVVTQFVLRPGNNVTAQNTLFMVVIENDFWIDANFKETQVERIKPGQSAKVILDMFPDHTFEGTVDAVSSASGAVFSLFPPENASGNWVKVTQRFPVKVLLKNLDSAFPLRAGATATVTINTNK